MNLYYFLAIVPAIVLHEVSHGIVAYWCGDPTAKNARRLTLNPLRHIDPFGTIILPVLLVVVGLPPIGYAKPVPVNFRRLRHPREQGLLVSLAGPTTNFLLSAIAWVVCRILLSQSVEVTPALNFFVAFGIVNIGLGLFNLVPLPPLDGASIVEWFVPQRYLPKYAQIRARALPVVMILIILDSLTTNYLGHVLANVQDWWLQSL